MNFIDLSKFYTNVKFTIEQSYLSFISSLPSQKTGFFLVLR